MSLRDDVRSDINTARKIHVPTWALIFIFILSIPTFWVFDRFGNLDKSLPILECIVAFVFVVYVKRNLINKPWFWATIILLAASHGLVLWLIPWTSKWVPALIAGAAVSVDICLMLWIVAVVGRLVEGRAVRDAPYRPRT